MTLPLGPASIRQQSYLLELGLAALATLLLLALLANAERLVAAFRIGVAGKKAAGAAGVKRTASGKPKEKQPDAQAERQSSGKQPRAKQQEQRQKQGARGGKEAAGADKQQQERQAKAPAAVSQLVNGPKQQQAEAGAASTAGGIRSSGGQGKGRVRTAAHAGAHAVQQDPPRPPAGQ